MIVTILPVEVAMVARHTEGNSMTTLLDHSYGTPKRILSLLGQAETAPYSWNGNQGDLRVRYNSLDPLDDGRRS